MEEIRGQRATCLDLNPKNVSNQRLCTVFRGFGPLSYMLLGSRYERNSRSEGSWEGLWITSSQNQKPWSNMAAAIRVVHLYVSSKLPQVWSQVSGDLAFRC